MIALFFSRHLYRKATKPVELNENSGQKSLALSDDFAGPINAAELRYLKQISDHASLVIAEINGCGHHFHQLEAYYLTLFRDDFISVSDSLVSQQDSWPWLNEHPLNILSLGILRPLLPSNVKNLYDVGIAQNVIIGGVSRRSRMNGTTDDFQVTAATLAVLANKYKLEDHVDLMVTIEECLQSAFDLVTSESSLEDRNIGLEQASIIFTLAVILEASVTNSAGFIQGPLWMQKLYVDLVKPMISKASEAKESIIRNNYGVAILHMVKYMAFPIYEDDISNDTLAALDVLRTTMLEMPQAEQDHLRSIVNICITIFSQPQQRGDTRVLSKCATLALEIVGHLPRRGLAFACGHNVREVRSTARMARAAWFDMK
ncbi:hypothetical protein CDD81_7176 [Ophiocordyceps australis]|uniref:Uncharacterized protein n=1 Tax=Ophiocordyceps australis TaxID=1399860 RepID=A0A2C5Y4M3_9HYPO|nr:hypothetical protein CDD81_7176 [Ophiocordyceps australis]